MDGSVPTDDSRHRARGHISTETSGRSSSATSMARFPIHSLKPAICPLLEVTAADAIVSSSPGSTCYRG
eukprot:scaffold55105_cov33-Prasinocladus_malaysianus.AAC.1